MKIYFPIVFLFSLVFSQDDLLDLINGESNFNIALVDYNIKVPKVVRSNIAEVINVNVSVQLNPR